jgi:hypothetical protein
MRKQSRRAWRVMLAAVAAGALAFFAAGCPRNQTTLDDRTLENKPQVETERPVDRSDPFRP